MVPELANHLARIEDLRSQIPGLLVELPAPGLNLWPMEGTDDHGANSLAVLATSVAGAEHFWIAEVIGHRPATRDRPAEFAAIAISADVDHPAPASDGGGDLSCDCHTGRIRLEGLAPRATELRRCAGA